MASVASIEDTLPSRSDDGDSSDWNESNTFNFWIGNKFFVSEISQLVLRGASSDCTYPELESTLHVRLRNYPCDENLRLLQDRLPTALLQDSTQGYEGFVAAVGAIVRKGRPQDKDILLQSLRSFGGEEIQGLPEANAPNAPNLPESNAPVLETTELAPEPEGAVASPHHKIALQEYGVAKGAIPRYVNKTISFTPAINQTTLHFQGWHTVAKGQTNKEAQQKAAMAVCRKLKLSVD